MSKKSFCCYCFSDIEYTGSKPLNCPKCGQGYWSKIPAEEICFKHQNDYLIYRGVSKKKADKALSDLYYFLIKYSIGMIKKMVKSKKIFEEEDLEDKGSQVACAFISKYLSDANYKVTSSFGKIISFALLPILFGEKIKAQDSTLSLDAILNVNSNSTKTELIDLVSSTEEKNPIEAEYIQYMNSSTDVRDSILALIDGLKQEVIERYDRITAINVIQGLYHLFQKKNVEFMALYYSTHGGIVVQGLVETMMSEVENYLRASEG